MGSAARRLQLVSEKGEKALLNSPLLLSIRALTRPGEGDFLSSLIKMYFKRGPELIQQLQTALEKSDAYAFERVAHALKGTSGNLGADRMMSLCEELEYIGKSADLSSVPPKIEPLKTCFQETIQILERDWLIKT